MTAEWTEKVQRYRTDWRVGSLRVKRIEPALGEQTAVTRSIVLQDATVDETVRAILQAGRGLRNVRVDLESGYYDGDGARLEVTGTRPVEKADFERWRQQDQEETKQATGRDRKELERLRREYPEWFKEDQA